MSNILLYFRNNHFKFNKITKFKNYHCEFIAVKVSIGIDVTQVPNATEDIDRKFGIEQQLKTQQHTALLGLAGLN